MKVYLSGKIGNGPDKELNIQYMRDFTAIYREKLKPYNCEIICPLELNTEQDNWSQCMKNDIIGLCRCDAILMLDNWTTSPGAHLELHIAHRLGIRIFMDINYLVDSLALEF